MIADLADGIEDFAKAVDNADPKTIEELIANTLLLIVKLVLSHSSQDSSLALPTASPRSTP